jgi:hypothetical protein
MDHTEIVSIMVLISINVINVLYVDLRFWQRMKVRREEEDGSYQSCLHYGLHPFHLRLHAGLDLHHYELLQRGPLALEVESQKWSQFRNFWQ